MASPSVASPGDWAAHRATITNLYQNQRMTLKEVRKFMQDEYKFIATAKMYKTRFERWGLQKNLTAKQVAELLRQKTTRDAVGKPTDLYVRGKKIPNKKLETYVRRTSKENQNRIHAALSGFSGSSGSHHEIVSMVLCRMSSPVPSVSSCLLFNTSDPNPKTGDSTVLFGVHSSPFPFADMLPPTAGEGWMVSRDSSSISEEDHLTSTKTYQFRCPQSLEVDDPGMFRRKYYVSSLSHLLPLATPDSLALPEECMHLLREYVFGNFESGSWREETFMVNHGQVVDWYNQANEAVSMLHRGHVKQAFRLLGNSLDQYGQVLAGQSYTVFFETCKLILRLTDGLTDLAKAFMKHAGEMSQIMHKSRHPFATLMKKMYVMDIAELQQYAVSFFDCYSECLESCFGTTSAFSIEITTSRCFATERLAIGRLLDLGTAENYMKKSLAILEPYGDLASIASINVKRCLGELYYHDGRYDEARSMTSEILDLAVSYSWYDDMEECYRKVCHISRADAGDGEILSSFSQWVTFTEATFGRGDDRTVAALSEKEWYLRETGRDDLADEALESLNAALDELCLEDESIRALEGRSGEDLSYLASDYGL